MVFDKFSFFVLGLFIGTTLGYFRFDKVRLVVHAPGVTSVNVSVNNTPDRESGLYSDSYLIRQKVMDAEERVKVYVAEDDNDYEIKHFKIAFTISICKIAEAVQKNLFHRLIAENFADERNSQTCVKEKGSTYGIQDLMITDALLPPFRKEVRFKAEFHCFVKLDKKKKFIRTHTITLYGRVKK